MTRAQYEQLRAATLFQEGLPVPVTALIAVGRAMGVDSPACLPRLRGLGLVDSWGEDGGIEQMAANPLARPLAAPELDAAQCQALAAAAIGPLAAAWQTAGGDFPTDRRAVEAARLARIGGAGPEILEPASHAAGYFLFHHQHEANEALQVLEAALARIDAAGESPTPRLLLLASRCARRIGEPSRQIAFLEQGLKLKTADTVGLAELEAEFAFAVRQKDPERALERLHDAADRLQQAGAEHSRAVTLGFIADILQQRGETDEALRIRREEELPVYEKLGDVHQRAVTMGFIADILQQRGETDEALRIRREEELPVYEKLGDVRELLVGRTNLAINLLQRQAAGDREEAAELLNQARQAAEQLKIPEADVIRQWQEHYGLLPE